MLLDRYLGNIYTHIEGIILFHVPWLQSVEFRLQFREMFVSSTKMNL